MIATSFIFNGPVDARHARFISVSSGVAIPVERARLDPRQVFVEADLPRFVGREWLTDQVDQFLSRHRRGYVWVEAEAGLGKTAFAAHLASSRGYLSHFTRLPNGERTPVALRNLAAQLIVVRDLPEHGFLGVVPAEAQTPEGFGDLLAAAAGTTGEPLVIVLDGLDEADQDAGRFPFGLPTALPDGVFVICTFRTGYRPGIAHSPHTTLLIEAADDRNLADIRRYLSNAVNEDAIATMLTGQGVAAEEFADQLLLRCGGAWDYLRYVLDEVRSGQRGVRQLDDLPAYLPDLYLRSIDHWLRGADGRLREDWARFRRRVLATLAAAAEPVDVDTLTAFAGVVGPSEVRQLCSEMFRPFLSVHDGQYSISHPGLRDFLHGALPPPRHGDHPKWRRSQAEEIGQETIAAHARISDHYLRRFGGLDHGLPALAAQPGLAGADGGYPRRHLSRHLQRGGRVEDLHRLLVCEHASGSGRAVNIWHAVHDHAGTMDGYHDDIELARQQAAQDTDAELAAGRPARLLGVEIRYLLMAASVHHLSDAIPPVLVPQLLSTRIWDVPRALVHAQVLRDPATRAHTAAVLAGHLPIDQRAALVRDALTAAAAISEHESRVGALAALAVHLPEDQLTRTLDDALATIRQSSALSSLEFDRARMLDLLAPRLRVEQLRTAMTIAEGLDDPGERGRALVTLVPHLPWDERAQALELALAASSTSGSDYRLPALMSELAPHLSLEQFPAALTAANGYSQALIALLPYLPHDARNAALGQILNGPEWEFPARDLFHALVLAGLARFVTRDQLSDAIAAGRAIVAAHRRAEVLINLGNDRADREAHFYRASRIGAGDVMRPVPRLRVGSLRSAVAVMEGVLGPLDGAEALAAVASRLAPDPLRAVVTAAHVVPDQRLRTAALSALLPYLAADRLAPAVTQILLGRGELNAETPNHALVWAVLSDHVTGDQFRDAVTAAWSVIAEHDHDRRGESPRWGGAGGAIHVDHRTGELVDPSPRLGSDQVRAALAAARTMGDLPDRVAALSALASHLPAGQQVPVLRRALAATHLIPRDRGRRVALTALALNLAPDQLPGAVALARSMTHAPDRVRTLVALLPHLPDGLRADALRQAFTDCQSTDDISWMAESLGTLAPHLTAEQLHIVVATARELPDLETRVDLLAALAPQVPDDNAADVFIAAQAVNATVEALAALLPQLPPNRGRAVRDVILVSARYHRNDWDRDATALVEQAPSDLQDQFRDAVTAARALNLRALSLATLAAHLPEHQRDQVRDHFLTAPRTLFGACVLAVLAPYLVDDQLDGAVAAVLAISDGTDRTDALATLAPHLAEDRRTAAIADAHCVTESGPEELSTLVPYLSNQQRDEARDRALASDRPYLTARVLAALAPYIAPAERSTLLDRALAAADRVGIDIGRRAARESLAPHLSEDQLARIVSTVRELPVSLAIALLERARGLGAERAGAAVLVVELLRSLLRRRPRVECLAIIGHLAPSLVTHSGVLSISECVTAIEDVGRWWP